MGPPVGTPFLSASSLTKYQRKKKANGGNGSGYGAMLPDDTVTSLSLSQSHSLYAGNNHVMYGQLNAHGGTGISSLYPSSLTPNVSSLSLLGMGTDGVSPLDHLGYFSSPRPEDGGGSGSGMTPGHQFFMFGSAGRTPSSAPFSAGVSEVDTAERSRYERGSLPGPKGGSYSSGQRQDRHDYYRTGLTPATNDNESPMKPSNSNTPLSDIGDISISSSVFSPSFSPGRAFGIPSSGHRGDDRDRDRDKESSSHQGSESEKMRRRERNAQFNSKSPRTEEALSLLADCIAVASKAPNNRSTHSNSGGNQNQPLSPPLTPSANVLKRMQSRPQSGAASAVKSGDRSFSLNHQQYYPMVTLCIVPHTVVPLIQSVILSIFIHNAHLFFILSLSFIPFNYQVYSGTRSGYSSSGKGHLHEQVRTVSTPASFLPAFFPSP